jgi:hypothetical protein
VVGVLAAVNWALDPRGSLEPAKMLERPMEMQRAIAGITLYQNGWQLAQDGRGITQY